MEAIARAQQRIEDAAAGRTDPAAFDATLERARHAVESLAATTARFEAGLPEAIQDGLRQHFRPSARHLAEVRGLTSQVIRRLERIEGDILSERHARVDDLALLVDLIASGWRSVEERLGKLEEGLTRDGAVGYRLGERQAAGGGVRTGRTRTNRLPRPGSLSSSSRPPSASASSRAIVRPSPVPPPSPDQNGRKIRSASCGAIPGPVSATATLTSPFSAASPRSTRPPAGVQWSAFAIRLVTICSTRSPSVTSTAPCPSARSSSMP